MVAVGRVVIVESFGFEIELLTTIEKHLIAVILVKLCGLTLHTFRRISRLVIFSMMLVNLLKAKNKPGELFQSAIHRAVWASIKY